MKILLHLGQGKTGTTALQQSLHNAADALRARGILYPRFGGNKIAHHLLLPLCGDPGNLPFWTLNNLGGPKAAAKKARIAWDATCDDIRQNPPDLLVLSSELLLSGTDRDEKARLAGLLSSLSRDIVPILYFRHPVEFYRSSLQEMLKAESRPHPPVGLNWRKKIEDIEAAFPQPPVFVAYDRATLFQGDTIPDFAHRFLAPRIKVSDLPWIQANLGLSAEALVLLAQMRAQAGGNAPAAQRIARLKAHLYEFDRIDPPAKPLTLLPEVAEAALHSATCHRWLAETGRLQIPGLDTGSIDGATVPDWMMTAAPETMFLHDPGRLARLRRAIDQLGPSPVRGWNTGASKRSAPRLRDRFLQFLNRKIVAMNQVARAPEKQQTGKPESEEDSKAP